MRQLFKQLDINSDGEINFEEFLTGVRDRRLANSKAGRLLSNNLRDQSKTRLDNPSIKKLFIDLDTDNSNTINFNEMK